MQDWEAWVRGQRIAILWQFDTIRNDLSGYGVYTKTMADRFRIVFKSFHFFYRLRIQKFADTDPLRVNRRPIRKDFFPDRYVFTSSSCKRGLNSPCAGPRNRPKSGCCGPAEAAYKLFSRQWRKKKVTSGSFRLSCGFSWHNATIFLIKLSSWRIYQILFARRPVTSFLVSFWLKSSNVDSDGFWMELLCKILAACIGKQRTIPEKRKS